MKQLPSKERLLLNFSHCNSWEEKYLYIIELGKCLLPFQESMRNSKNLISGCQSQTWIVVKIEKNGKVKLYGDSNASITKGLIAIVFSIYHDLTSEEIISYNVKPFFDSLKLTQHLTPSRSQGLGAIVESIRSMISTHQS
ncbi:cysteine desulfuration protein SufE [Sodalis sp. CWE]|uniref:cysteine desulfuration protein SufE n=1 Tax=Sodalis sp. CWE TaxID=2803816 RepID=UPI001C7D133D|nr:cysteine desulfuration protein SufE [Sodalis sp. CWE]MBX4181154.1 cysteine desulfuration protein SufE [Sodalis sp. CWE]